MTRDRRESLRFETCCLVKVQSAEHGISHCVVRNLSEGGVFLETHSSPLPIGAAVRIMFEDQSDPQGTRLAALGEVKNHYFIHYGQDRVTRAITGMGVRFIRFEDRSDDVCVPRTHAADVTLH
jgi:hypothetical protein